MITDAYWFKIQSFTSECKYINILVKTDRIEQIWAKDGPYEFRITAV